MKVKIENNKQLKKLNTFGVGAGAKYFATVKNVNELKQVLQSRQFNQSKKYMVLGGGSNVLFVKDYDGFLIKNKIKSIKVVKKTKAYTYIKFGAGEIWDNCVKYAVDLGVGGIENMAYIPGTIGGAAVQNIAAYNQNIEDAFYNLVAINRKNLVEKKFNKKDCDFTYRNSRFKKHTNNWIVVSVTLKLKNNPTVDANYYEKGLNKTSVQSELELIAKPPYKVGDIYKAVTSLRKKRIPEVKVFPNPGSFFRNPIISKTKYLKIKNNIPNLQFYPTKKLKYVDNTKIEREKVKVSYGQLIDLGLGLKGYIKGNVGIHPKHAAFIYTNGRASGKEVYKFSKWVKGEIYKKYKIKLQEEVKIIL